MVLMYMLPTPLINVGLLFLLSSVARRVVPLWKQYSSLIVFGVGPRCLSVVARLLRREVVTCLMRSWTLVSVLVLMVVMRLGTLRKREQNASSASLVCLAIVAIAMCDRLLAVRTLVVSVL